MFAKQALMCGAAGWITMVLLGLLPSAAGVPQQKELTASDQVQTLQVEITVGAEGEELTEPLALDLGLGFPFWLAPVGQAADAHRPFGAMPRTGGASSVAPGQTATFEYSASEEAGLDTLQTSTQLLAGLQVGDIRRIGVASRGEQGWVLAGYKVLVNGQLLAESDHVDSNALEQRTAASTRLEEIAAEIAAQQAEIADLEALVAAGVGAEADQQRLEELQIEIAPQVIEQRQLDHQLQGQVPWYMDGDFHPAGESDSFIRAMKITVVTAPHTGADSRNFVYFRTGGHKHLLGSPTAPLTPSYGPQEFVLDMVATPLQASDLRGFGLGMIANDLPQGDAPDRWHPERLIVEVDDRVIYDSENNALDSASLAAIRLIPPAHRNAAGQIVTNASGAREAWFWEAGKGQGLDLLNGGTEDLPPPGSSDAPIAEPGLTIDDADTVIVADDVWYDPGADPFPGEQGFGPGWQPGWPWPPGWMPGWGPGWGPGPSLQDLLMFGLLEELGLLPDWVIPLPVGPPPQVEQVTIDTGTGSFEWIVTGDATQIDHFVADVILVRPDLNLPFVQSVSQPLLLPASARSASLLSFVLNADMPTFDEASRSYRAIRVAIVPTDPALGCDPALSPAFPRLGTDLATHLTVAPLYHYEPFMGPPMNLPVAFGGDPGPGTVSVWVAGQTDSHNGLVFAGFSPIQHHTVARPVHDGDHLTVRLTGDLQGRYRLIAFVGFQGGLEFPGSVNVGASCLVYELANPANQITYPAMAHLDSDPNVSPSPMQPIIVDIDTLNHIGPGQMGLSVTYHINCIHVDPAHPPMLTGVRLLPAP